jgi:transposase
LSYNKQKFKAGGHKMKAEIQVEFSEEDRARIEKERYTHPDPRVRQRMEILFLKSIGIPNSQIPKLAGVSPNTMRTCFRLYQLGGLGRITKFLYHRPPSPLNAFIDEIKKSFEQAYPATIKEAQQRIEEITGLHRCETLIRKFLKKTLLFSRRKTGTTPAKADPAEQQKFLDEELKPRLEEAKAGKRAVFFVDASHFVLSAFLGFLWSMKRVFVKSPCGRQRFNVLGALNAITHELITVTNDTYITATTVCELLEKLSALNLSVPITFILDNARYQKCPLVLEKARSLNIELCYLPTYSPNLNLIERLWKFIKKKCLNNKYHKNFSLFKEAIGECLAEVNGKHKSDLLSLLTLNFQIIKPQI